MKKLNLSKLSLVASNMLSAKEKREVIGGQVPYTYECFYCTPGAPPICLSLRKGIDPEPC